MNTWFHTLDCDALKTILRYSPSMYLISKPDGTILWANVAFCEWSQYTLSELTKMTWMQLSLDDKDLATDLEMLTSLTPYNLSYSVQKRYIPKNGKPVLGNLHVVRYPPTGDIQFCWCRWEPLCNGTAEAFETALAAQSKMEQAISELTKEVRTLTAQTEEQKFTWSIVAMIQKHPKKALAFVIFAASLGGFDTLLNTLQRLGVVQPAPVVVKEIVPP